MKVVIDTNSLLSLVRYYLPFDKNSVLLNFFKKKIETGEIILIDKVFEECTYNSKGLVIETLFFLKDKKILKVCKDTLQNRFITRSISSKISSTVRKSICKSGCQETKETYRH